MYTIKPYHEQLKYRCVSRFYFDNRYRYAREREDLERQGRSIDEIYDEIGAPPPKKPSVDQIIESIAYTFQRREKGEYTPARFNTDDYPAIYTASNSQTAFGERRHHWVKGLSTSNPEAGYVIYTVRFTGSLRDVRAAVAAGAVSFLDEDYWPCQAIADQARDDGLAGVVAPSKRVPSGNCCAVFKKDTLNPIDVIDVGTFGK
jgi:RES domain-containing protein